MSDRDVCIFCVCKVKTTFNQSFIEAELFACYSLLVTLFRGVATNNGLEGEKGGAGSNRHLFCTVSTSVVQRNSVNNIEDDIKQSIYTGMEVISFIPP